jgi:hypothetical protein
MTEAGYPDIQGDGWLGVPATTPKDIVTSRCRTKERLAMIGFDPVASTPEEFATRIRVEIVLAGQGRPGEPHQCAVRRLRWPAGLG